MSDDSRKNVVVELLHDEVQPAALSVDALLDRIQRAVSHTRTSDPTLSHYHLHDVSLRVTDGKLHAVLDFRK